MDTPATSPATLALFQALAAGSQYGFEEAFRIGSPNFQAQVKDLDLAEGEGEQDSYARKLRQSITALKQMPLDAGVFHVLFAHARAWRSSFDNPYTAFKDTLKDLLDAKAPLNRVAAGKTPLMAAAQLEPEYFNASLFGRLVRGTPKDLLGLRDEHGKSALEYVIESQSWQRARQLIERGAPVDYVDKNGENLIFKVARHFRHVHRNKRYVVLGIIHLLHEKGVSLTQVNNFGQSFLFVEPSVGDMAKFLDAGVDPNARDHEGMSLTERVLLYGNSDAARSVLSHPRTDLKLDGPEGVNFAHLQRALGQALQWIPDKALLFKAGLDPNYVDKNNVAALAHVLSNANAAAQLVDHPDFTPYPDGKNGIASRLLQVAISSLKESPRGAHGEWARIIRTYEQKALDLSVSASASSARSRM